MLSASRVLLALAGILLILDVVLMATGTPNPPFGWPMPCPITVAVLGPGMLLFVLSGAAFGKV